ncbi:MAG TPA: hypothetical protein VK881_11375 [bacterium]|nr:hypothetical protein [bacterium]
MDALIPVTFRFPAVLTPEAQRVSLIGPFNKWTPNVHPLARAGDYWWTITLYFPPGRRIVYCFDVDGATCFDPNNGVTPNGRESECVVRGIERLDELPPSFRSRKTKSPSGVVA